MTEGGRSFAVTTCQFWNSLSLELRNSVSLESFKNDYRNNLFDVQRTTSLNDVVSVVSIIVLKTF